MLKKFACLLILILLLALTVGCAAKSRSASPEDVLEEIASSRWEIDVDASMRVDSDAREEIETMGRDKFAHMYGQVGFSLDMQKHEFIWYESREVVDKALTFTVAPENAEDAAERTRGVRQAQLILHDNSDIPITLRYDEAGKLQLFAKGELFCVLAPLGK